LIALPRLGGAALYHLDLRLYGYVNWDYYNLGSQLVVFLACFLLGYVIYASPPLLRAVHRDGPVALTLGILLFAVLQTPAGHFASVTEVTPGGILITCARAESEWLLIAGALSIALRFFTVSNSLLRYLSEAAYPLYVLHMPVLILVGVTVVQWNLPLAITLPLVVIAALALTLAFYEFVVKRIMPLRLLFGLRARPAKAAARSTTHIETQTPR
jgi:glucan biosynthesis protein C